MKYQDNYDLFEIVKPSKVQLYDLKQVLSTYNTRYCNVSKYMVPVTYSIKLVFEAILLKCVLHWVTLKYRLTYNEHTAINIMGSDVKRIFTFNRTFFSSNTIKKWIFVYL